MCKKLLILMSSLNAGGAERHTIQLINKIDADRFRTTLRYFDRREALLGIIDRSQYESVECLHRRGRLDLSMLNKIRKLIDRQDPDAVLSISPYPLLYGYLARLLSGASYKLVTIIHQTMQRPGRWESVKARLFRNLLNKSDLIMFVCKNQLDYWVEAQNIDAKKCVYIYNGIDIEHFDGNESSVGAWKGKRPYNIGNEDIVLGNVAGFRSEKKQEDIIQAAKLLREMGYPIKVLLVGDGPRRRFIEQYVESCGLQEHVILTGLQKDVRPFLELMDCFVISSHQETFSLAALEAMAAGKPLLMTDVGGAAEMLENAGAVDDLAEHVKNLIEKRAFEEMGKNSRKIVAERFTLQKMVREYEVVFTEL
jgi:glycosyltransferase involved in cell wall biosynthesis